MKWLRSRGQQSVRTEGGVHKEQRDKVNRAERLAVGLLRQSVTGELPAHCFGGVTSRLSWVDKKK